jgi:hypothetical protein
MRPSINTKYIHDIPILSNKIYLSITQYDGFFFLTVSIIVKAQFFKRRHHFPDRLNSNTITRTFFRRYSWKVKWRKEYLLWPTYQKKPTKSSECELQNLIKITKIKLKPEKLKTLHFNFYLNSDFIIIKVTLTLAKRRTKITPL